MACHWTKHQGRTFILIAPMAGAWHIVSKPQICVEPWPLKSCLKLTNTKQDTNKKQTGNPLTAVTIVPFHSWSQFYLASIEISYVFDVIYDPIQGEESVSNWTASYWSVCLPWWVTWPLPLFILNDLIGLTRSHDLIHLPGSFQLYFLHQVGFFGKQETKRCS